jgi:hypothetical protein
MSLINDALKRAQQNQSSPTPPQIPPLRELKMMPAQEPAKNAQKTKTSRAVPMIVISLVLAAGIAGAWVMSHRPSSAVALVTPEPPKVEKNVEPITPTATTPPPAPTAPIVAPAQDSGRDVKVARAPVEVKPAVVLNPQDAPKLQGIFYAPHKSSAILNGKVIQTGDKILQYRVKEISQTTVTLVDAGGRAVKLSMGD